MNVTPVLAPVVRSFFALVHHPLFLLVTVGLISLLSFDNWTVFNTPAPDSIDGAWSIALNVAHNRHFWFGTDIAFTYGPLGFLTSTRLPIAIRGWQMLAYDGWLLLQTGLIIWLVLKDRFTLLNTLCVTGLVLYLHNAEGGEPPFLLFFFSLFLLCHHLKTATSARTRPGLLLYAGAISLFAFYIKASVGLASVGCYGLYVVYWTITRRQRIGWLAALLGISLLALLGSAWLLRTNLIPYVRNSLQIVSSYNDVMLLLPDDRNFRKQLLIAVAALGLYGLLVLLWGLLPLVRRVRQAPAPRRDTWLIVGLATLPLFILFKQGFVRADPAHCLLFFKYAALPLILLIIFAQPAWFRIAMRLPLLMLIGYRLVGMPFSFTFHQPTQVAMYLGDVVEPTNYGLKSALLLPQRWQQLIRPASVDVIPIAVGLVYSNQLTAAYRPRPVFQSYQVTNRYLDSMNAASYRSARGPAYLIYTHSAIDDRYAFADEARTKVVMLQHYAVADRQSDWVLLQRRAQPLSLDTVGVSTRTGQLGESIPLPTTPGVQLVQIGVHYSWLGVLTRLLFQPPSILLEMELENGQRLTHRIGKTLLENGLISNRYVKNNVDFVRYMQSAGRDGQAVRAIRVIPRRWRWGFEPSFNVVFTNLNFSLPTTGAVAQRLDGFVPRAAGVGRK